MRPDISLVLYMVVVSMLAFVEFRSVSHALPLYSLESDACASMKDKALMRGQEPRHLEDLPA